MVMQAISGGDKGKYYRQYNNKTNIFDAIVDKYKSLDLKLYVVRRAHAKCFDDSEGLISEETKICRQQDELLAQLCDLKLSSHNDVLKCLEVWHLETIGNRKHGTLKPAESVILKVYEFLKRAKT